MNVHALPSLKNEVFRCCKTALIGVLALGIFTHAAHAQTCAPPPSGLVSWWPGNGNTLDVVGTNNGNLVDNAAFGAGNVDNAFSFDCIHNAA
jgi:hypothetical protein